MLKEETGRYLKHVTIKDRQGNVIKEIDVMQYQEDSDGYNALRDDLDPLMIKRYNRQAANDASNEARRLTSAGSIIRNLSPEQRALITQAISVMDKTKKLNFKLRLFRLLNKLKSPILKLFR